MCRHSETKISYYPRPNGRRQYEERRTAQRMAPIHCVYVCTHTTALQQSGLVHPEGGQSIGLPKAPIIVPALPGGYEKTGRKEGSKEVEVMK